MRKDWSCADEIAGNPTMLPKVSARTNLAPKLLNVDLSMPTSLQQLSSTPVFVVVPVGESIRRRDKRQYKIGADNSSQIRF
jgi:hypothetical protein